MTPDAPYAVGDRVRYDDSLNFPSNPDVFTGTVTDLPDFDSVVIARDDGRGSLHCRTWSPYLSHLKAAAVQRTADLRMVEPVAPDVPGLVEERVDRAAYDAFMKTLGG